MKIQQSSLDLASYAHAESSSTRRSRIAASPPSTPAPPPAERVTLSNPSAAEPQAPEPGEEGWDLRAAMEQHPLWGMVRRLIMAVTGEEPDMDAIAPENRKSSQATSGSAGTSAASAGDRLEVTTLTVRVDTEAVEFSASGEVTTADGRRIALNSAFTLARKTTSVTASRSESGGAPNRKDPLVINLSAASASLNGAKIAFDVNADGSAERIAFLSEGSGFLALDRNADRVINDGSELFGALSGDGFADLASYDDDANGWIDENDVVWNQLLVWSKQASGEDIVQSLRAAGIGAIALDRVATPFALQGKAREDLGALRTTGLFLHEDGRVGSVQQLDLTV